MCVYIYVFTDKMLTLCFGLQVQVDWIWVGLGNFKRESERGVEDKFFEEKMRDIAKKRRK